MGMILENLAFAGFLAAQFLGVVAVHAARKNESDQSRFTSKRKIREPNEHCDPSEVANLTITGVS